MKITAILENTAKNNNMQTEHGLSIFIETKKHKILFDMGQSGMFAENAKKLGIDLTSADIAILSHGHYDHGGGLNKFLEINKNAPVYISKYAFEPHFSGTEKYIGLDVSLKGNKRFVEIGKELIIDDELTIYPSENYSAYPVDSFGLNMLENNRLVPDDFRHEQYLMINENGKKVLISGCSHKGILNITERFKPDILIGGFHFVKLDPEGIGKNELKKSAEILGSLNTAYYTCHCTGTEQFEFMKTLMGEKLSYLSCGEVIEI